MREDTQAIAQTRADRCLASTMITIGVNLKMYFSLAETVTWCDQLGRIASTHPATQGGLAEVFVLPCFPAISAAVHALRGTGVKIGAQDLFWEDRGPFSGEVGGSILREVGCDLVEVGHSERRRIFGETSLSIGRKVAAAYRNGLVPLVCVGEERPMSADDATADCLSAIETILEAAAAEGELGSIVVAYEPQWAIGASAPASVAHIVGVCRPLRRYLIGNPALRVSQVIYGGSAGPGLLGQLGSEVDGLFLGRRAHDVSAVHGVLDETFTLGATQSDR